MKIARFFLLDASAIVKLLIEERGSGNLRMALASDSPYHFEATFICLAEALGVLKRELDKGRLVQKDYFRYVGRLLGYIASEEIRISSIDMKSLPTIIEVLQVAHKHSMDFSDALTFKTMGTGVFTGESELTLVTSDRKMLNAAAEEKIKTWDPEDCALSE